LARRLRRFGTLEFDDVVVHAAGNPSGSSSRSIAYRPTGSEEARYFRLRCLTHGRLKSEPERRSISSAHRGRHLRRGPSSPWLRHSPQAWHRQRLKPAIMARPGAPRREKEILCRFCNRDTDTHISTPRSDYRQHLAKVAFNRSSMLPVARSECDPWQENCAGTDAIDGSVSSALLPIT
jgi:hypothetical protein